MPTSGGRTQGYASPDQIAAGADVQNWDPSVKALTAFPQVLALMARNLQWTTDLGNAYYNQPQDVFESVQVMRQRAQAAGTLQSTPQEAVHNDQGYIQLTPVNPQVVYVPTYNPWTVYGEQVSPYPGFSLVGALGSFFGSSPINYGLGIAMSAFSDTPWGWLAWGLNWLAQSVLFHQSDYYSHSTTVANWGFRPGLHAYAAREVFARHSYERTQAVTAGSATDTTGTADRDSDAHRTDMPGTGKEIPTAAPAYRGDYYRTPRQAYNYAHGTGEQAAAVRQPWLRIQLEPGSRRRLPRRRRAGYGRSTYAYRAPSSGFQRGGFDARSSGAFASRDFARSAEKPSHAGGFHLFGGRHEPKNVSSRSSGGFHMGHMGGGGHVPKSSYGGGKHFGGGHSHSGGGHSHGGHSSKRRS